MSDVMIDRIGDAIGTIIADAVIRFVVADTEPTVDNLREYADRVLAAMREPTSEMVYAANTLTARQIIMPGTVWETMIDAAAREVEPA
jgi:hypothetical protein